MIRLRLLGSVDLVGHDGQPLDAALRRSKAVAVLAYLAAARPRGFHRRDKIAALFWPELNADRARAALRVTLTRLRDDLGDDVILTRAADEIAVDASRLWCDVAALDDAIRESRALEAAAYFRGELLDGVHVDGTAEELEHWIDAERARIRADLRGVLLAESDRADQRGDREASLVAARRCVEIAANDEIANRRLIALLAAMATTVATPRAYDELARRLEREFQVEPSAETQARSQFTKDPANDRGTQPRATRLSFLSSESAPPHNGGRARSRLIGAAVIVAVVVRPPSSPTRNTSRPHRSRGAGSV